MRSIKIKIIQWWYSFWIHLAYFLHLRVLSVRFQRWIKGEHKKPRSLLISPEHPLEVINYTREHDYKWRPDQTRVGGITIPLDWVSEPEVFQARLEMDPSPEGDGDCDDRHYWSATCYENTPGVKKVLMCSVGYPGGGHTVCTFLYEGQWWLDNYRLQQIRDPNDIPKIIAEWGTEASKEPAVYWYVFETLDFKPVAIGPTEKV